MTESLRQRLLSIDPKRPYVWKLRLTEEEYRQLRDYVKGNSRPLDRDFAVLSIIYIAEWYKREYDGNVQNPLGHISAESLWEASGLDAATYVYQAKKTRRHLESIYVLGGLPMRYAAKDNKLLKALCRIYKGDRTNLEDDKAVGNGQAIAFQESILQYASLYQFLKSLLLGNAIEVYAEEDLGDKSSDASQFVAAIQSAYDEVLRDKFRLEWIVEYEPSSPYMRRMLRLFLRPEELGGLHQYLKFERAASWGFPALMRQRTLRVSLRFWDGCEIVGNDDTRRTILTFENSGQSDTGFVATGTMPWAVLRALPNVPFDRISVIVTGDDGKAYEVQHFDCKMQYMQLWAMPGEINRWCSTRNDQNDTAVVYTNYYEIEGGEHIVKPFIDKSNGISGPWDFAFIEDHVQLKHDNASPVTLWNRNGYIKFAPALYPDVLRYNAGKVRYLYNEDPDIYSEPETEDWYPAVFRLKDIRAHHFATRDTVNCLPDNLPIDKIEFKQFNAPDSAVYQEWTEYNKPEYGRVKLRLTIKDDEKIYPVLYLPSLFEHGIETSPVLRDFDNCLIDYADDKKQRVKLPVNIPMNKEPLGITIPVKVWGDGNESAELDVILPTLIKEIYLDGRVTKYLADGEQFILPYLLKDRISIHDYSRDGYSEYDCFNVGDLAERGSIERWEQGIPLRTKGISAAIPQYVHVSYGTPENTGAVRKMMYWDYSLDNPPREVDVPFKGMSDYSILFQDMRHINEDLACIPPETRNGWNGDGWDSAWDMDGSAQETKDEENALRLRCFDIATMYKTYYFIFNPLYNLTDEAFIEGICLPLKDRRNGSLAEEDLRNLMRCAIECGLGWTELSTKILN